MLLRIVLIEPRMQERPHADLKDEAQSRNRDFGQRQVASWSRTRAELPRSVLVPQDFRVRFYVTTPLYLLGVYSTCVF